MSTEQPIIWPGIRKALVRYATKSPDKLEYYGGAIPTNLSVVLLEGPKMDCGRRIEQTGTCATISVDDNELRKIVFSAWLPTQTPTAATLAIISQVLGSYKHEAQPPHEVGTVCKAPFKYTEFYRVKMRIPVGHYPEDFIEEIRRRAGHLSQEIMRVREAEDMKVILDNLSDLTEDTQLTRARKVVLAKTSFTLVERRIDCLRQILAQSGDIVREAIDRIARVLEPAYEGIVATVAEEGLGRF